MSTPRVSLPVFEGPLDLLLYLIRRDELDIWDIPISRITDEYLRYVEVIQELNLDAAGDFVVMAATLTQIKSKMLLPSVDQLLGEDDEEGDPRLPLIERLLEYERYRVASKGLAGRPLRGREVFGSAQDVLSELEGEVPLPRVELFDLVEALRQVMEKARLRGYVHHIDVERFSVVDRIHWLHDQLERVGPTSFRALFGGLSSRMDMVLTFLAVLEMLKRGILTLGELGEGDFLLTLRDEDVRSKLELLINDRALDVV